MKIAALVVIAGLLAGVRIGADYYVNGLDRQGKIAAMQENMAHPWYKPSTELNKKHIGLYLKDRGISLTQMVVDHRWFEHTLQTAIGIYGYFTFAAPQSFYQIFKWILLILFAITGFLLMIRGSNEDRFFSMLALFLAVALLGVSLYRSWTIDFQAQGRYLFPILPMLGVLLARARELFDNRLFILCLVHLFLLSSYSFIFVGLALIPRISG